MIHPGFRPERAERKRRVNTTMKNVKVASAEIVTSMRVKPLNVAAILEMGLETDVCANVLCQTMNSVAISLSGEVAVVFFLILFAISLSSASRGVFLLHVTKSSGDSWLIKPVILLRVLWRTSFLVSSCM